MNAVFIHNPKTAGLYIQEALGLEILRYPHRARNNFKQKGCVTFGHLNYPKLIRRGVVSEEFDSTAFKFAFCRNPYDRAVSHFFYAKRVNVIPKRLSFLDFSRTLCGWDGAFVPQVESIRGVKIDFIGYYEHLEGDLQTVAEAIEREVIDIPRKNVTHHNLYASYYCKKSKRNIERFYRSDFKRFKYEYDDNLLHR